MSRISLGLVFVALGCSRPNKGVCCETAQQCEVIGLSADSVGKYNCDEGLVCADEVCVIPADASSTIDGGDGSGSGSGSGSGTSNGRCDLAKPFGAPQVVPNINTGYDEKEFVLSSNELTAYILRDNPGDLITITSTTRGSIDDDFPIDATDSALANVGGRIGGTHIARSDHLWFEQYNGGLYVSERTNTTEPFGARTLLSIGSITNSGLHIVGTDSDALVLYFIDSDTKLQAAANHFAPHEFAEPVAQTSFHLLEGAISRDGLTLYYAVDGYGDVYVSTRSSTAVMFAPGTVVFPAAGSPAYVGRDGCEVYLSGSDVLVARRPM